MEDIKLRERYERGKGFAFLGGQTALKWFQNPSLAVEWKADESPVSLADRKAEGAIIEAIREHFPDDAIIGEEHGLQAGKSDWQWIIDPIDGTQSFIRGVPLWGTLLALSYRETILAGWCYMPALGDFISACPRLHTACEFSPFVRQADELKKLGPGATVNLQVQRLEEALWCHTSPDYFATAGQLAIHDRLQERCRWTRAWSDCYAFVLLATGRVDLVVEPKLNLWDVAAFEPIIHAAGGQIGDFSGAKTVGNGSIVAGNAQLFQQTIRLIQEI